MASDGLADAISAASLVLAGLAALYTLWLPEVTAARAIKKEGDPNNRGPQKLKADAALRPKALPLALASGAVVLILVPRGVCIVVEVILHWREWAYDDIKALFLLVLGLQSMLAVAAIRQFSDLRRVRKGLDA